MRDVAGPADQLVAERARLDLDRRRLELDESWPRKWGAVLLGAAATVSAAIVTAGLGLFAAHSAHEDALNNSKIAIAQRAVENDRTALDMYFRYVADKPDGSPHRPDHIAIIQTIAASPNLLDKLKAQVTTTTFDARSANTAPSEVGVGLPDVKSQTRAHVYGPADFLAYVQYTRPRSEESQRLTTALGNLGLRVPGQQAISPEKSPARNEIRIYRADHAHYAATLAVQLKQMTGLDFAVRGPIGGGRLPNGVMEIWLGNAS